MSIAASPLEQPLLSAQRVTKRYASVHALVDVSLAIRRGEVLALCGENGSGKSTLAKCLAGVVRRDAGDVLLDGAPCTFDQPRDAIDAGVALVTQDLTAVPGMSVAENVLLSKLYRATTRVRRRELVSRALPYLETVGLDVDPMRPYASLRAGERELVEIAKALASHPRVLILDEATARLPDPERLLVLVDRLRTDGLGVLFITHRLREIRRAADRAVVLRDGRVVGELEREQLSDERLSSMMVGRELAELYDRPTVSIGEPVLRVEHLTTDRSPVPISFTVRQGEIVGLAGLVGSGRSELLETIAGFRRSRRGRVVVGGTRVSPGSTGDALRLGVSLVPENRHRHGLVLDASVRENVTMSSLKVLALVDRKHQRAAAGAAVDQLAIRCASIEAPVRTLSGGNQQKVVMARCLAHRPRVLLLDEPTRGVDVGARAEIYRIIAERIAAGMAIVIASSDLPEILGLSDRILVLHEGAVVAEVDHSAASEELLARLSAGGAGAARVS